MVEAGSDGSLLNSTIFKYGDLPTSIFQFGSSPSINNQTVDVFTGDFNADGYTDILGCTRMVGNPNFHTNFKIEHY